MHTYRGGSNWSSASWPGSGQSYDQTTWNYDAATGLLLSKLDAAGRGYTNLYHCTRTLWTRTWARGVTVTNVLNAFGQVVEKTYSDGTPAATFQYWNALGQLTGMANGWGAATLAYDPDGQLLSTTFTEGPFSGLVLTNHIDPLYGRDWAGVNYHLNDNQFQVSTDYGFDSYGRLATVTQGACVVSNAYLASSDLVRSLTAASSNSTVLTTTKDWEFGYRLRGISSALNSPAATITAFNYVYDAVDRRTRATLADGSAWAYDYDDRNEVVGSRHVWADQSTAAGQQFQYRYDAVGNRTEAWSGGDTHGGNLRSKLYTVNGLNQYTNITNEGYQPVTGVALATSAVSVNGSGAGVVRQGEYFAKELAVTNGSGPVWADATVSVTGCAVGGGLPFPGYNQPLGYDADGNLTFDGIWTYEWDAENRLSAMTITNVAWVPDVQRKRVEFAYDALGRRTLRKEYSLARALVTGVSTNASPWLRNEASGWVGFEFEVGNAPLTVSELGRWVVWGDSGTHTVKLVTYTGPWTGTDVPGGSTVVSMAGKPAGSFAYAALSAPVRLSANTRYYVLSQEVQGGDRWYHWADSQVSLNGAATAIGSASAPTDCSYYSPNNDGNQSYGPVSLRYRLSGTEVVTGVSTNASPWLRNEVGGWVGFEFEVGNKPLVVAELGRWAVWGDSGTHTVKLVTYTGPWTGTDVPGGSTVVSMAGKPAGSFAYAALSAPVRLSANTRYYVLSQEVQGGDRWYNYADSQVSLSGAATAIGSVSAPTDCSYYSPNNDGNQSYGPVSLRCAEWLPAVETRYVNDGWNLVAELDATNHLVRSHAWGLDLSGSLDGAGGIGGLVMIADHTSGGTTHFPCYDGNGNIVALVAQDGTVTARYEYGPFAEPIRVSGPYARSNPFRWSTKFTDETTGLIYYGERYYSPLLARWISKDPIEEQGGLNLYGFVGNNPINALDPLGRSGLLDLLISNSGEENAQRVVELKRGETLVSRVRGTIDGANHLAEFEAGVLEAEGVELGSLLDSVQAAKSALYGNLRGVKSGAKAAAIVADGHHIFPDAASFARFFSRNNVNEMEC